ncbi:hypothetical protein TLA_TLA_02049 [Tessaracoccus lapidicaptus]|nr:hypothetical protein TLA_TLA_02049 [Tessaracoccus lapidicaptus]
MVIRMRSTLIGLCAAAALTVGAGSAFAGEIKGTGELMEVKANSECAYSGLEDHPFEPGTVQTFGHVKRMYSATGGANEQMGPEGMTGCNARDYGMHD